MDPLTVQLNVPELWPLWSLQKPLVAHGDKLVGAQQMVLVTPHMTVLAKKQSLATMAIAHQASVNVVEGS